MKKKNLVIVNKIGITLRLRLILIVWIEERNRTGDLPVDRYKVSASDSSRMEREEQKEQKKLTKLIDKR